MNKQRLVLLYHLLKINHGGNGREGGGVKKQPGKYTKPLTHGKTTLQEQSVLSALTAVHSLTNENEKLVCRTHRRFRNPYWQVVMVHHHSSLPCPVESKSAHS